MSPLNENVDRLARDASALVRAVAPGDWPGGFAVIPDRLPNRICGLAFGSGEGLATFYRVRLASRAVLVDPWRLVDDLESPTTFEVARFESVALHEAAHALTLEPVDAERVESRLAELYGKPATYADLALYGYPRADLERLAAGVSANEPLAERLAAGGAWAALLAERLPDESTRTNAIVAAGVATRV
jgi:hypothetical protein